MKNAINSPNSAPEIDLRFTTLKQPLPSFVYDGIKTFVTDSNSYHHQSEFLRQKLAAKHGVTKDMIYLTSGADQAIFLLSHKYGQRTHIFTPTYIGYSDIKRFGYELHEHMSLEGSEYIVRPESIKNATLILLANPNNPAGMMKRDKILELVQNNPNAKVVVDEVYGDFATESVVDDVQRHKNLIVIRSFSKSHSLADFRIGYIIANPEIFESIMFETTWFNVAYPSVGAASVALENEAYFEKLRKEIIKERKRTEDKLISSGFDVVPSNINAVLIRFGSTHKAGAFAKKLKGAGILVNQGGQESNFGLEENFIRIGVGTAEHMQILRERMIE